MSAMIKHIRRSRPYMAVHAGCILDRYGKAEQVWTRLMIHMSEDIGPAERNLPASIMALRQAYKELRLTNPDGARQSLIHAIVLLATARKNRVVDHMAIMMYEQPLEIFGQETLIPDDAFDYHGRVGRELGRGMEHFFDHAAKLSRRQLDLEGICRQDQEEWETEARGIMIGKETEAREAAAEAAAGN
mgnify:CR=1 FL=1